MNVSVSLKNKESVCHYAKLASIHVRGLLVKKEIKYEQLSKILENNGVVLTASNLRNKVSGNSLSAGLFLMISSLLTEGEKTVVDLKN
jgi:hypothetical protein